MMKMATEFNSLRTKKKMIQTRTVTTKTETRTVITKTRTAITKTRTVKTITVKMKTRTVTTKTRTIKTKARIVTRLPISQTQAGVYPGKRTRISQWHQLVHHRNKVILHNNPSNSINKSNINTTLSHSSC